MATTAEIIQGYYNTILARTGSEADVAYWANQVDNVGIPLSQVEADFATSPEALTDVAPIVQMYEADLHRAPENTGLTYWVGLEESGTSLATIAADIAASAESQAVNGFTVGAAPTTAFVTNLYETILGRQPESAAAVAYWVGSGLSSAQIVAAISGSAEATADFAAKVSTYLSTVGGPSINTISLTTGADTPALSGNGNVINGAFNGSAATSPNTFNAGDVISASPGSTGNTLNLADLQASTNPESSTNNATNIAGITVSGVQTLAITAGEAVFANTATSIEGFTGLTALTIKDVGGTNATAAGTTAISVNDLAEATFNELINGGSSVTVTTGGDTSGAISIGATTAPTGAVVVTDGVLEAGSGIAGIIGVTGGTTVSVTENLATTDTTGANTVTGGAVTVSGTAITTSVTVNQTAPAAHTAGPPAVEGVVDGAVAINDVNTASLTKAGTITSVLLSNAGSGATINDNALTTLTLAGVTGLVTITDGLTTPTATTLTLNANAATGAGGITDTNNEIKTLNVVTGGAAASALGILSDTGLTALNVSGTQAVSLTPLSTIVGAVTVTGGAGLTIALNSPTTSFTSTSTGTDVVTIGASATKAITGNGTASEELVWNSGSAPAATAYLGNVSGFTVLGIGAAASGAGETFDMSKITGFTGFDVQADGTNVGTTTTLLNVAAGSPLAIDGTFAGTLVYSTADTAGPTDSLGLTLGATGNKTGFTVTKLIAEDSVLDGIGSLTVTSNASTAAAANIIATLQDASLTTLNVTGTGGLTIGTALTTNAASLTVTGTSTGTGGIILTGLTAANLTTLNLAGTDNVTLGTVTDGTGGMTVNGSTDNANVSLTVGGIAGSGKIDAITLGNGANSVTDTVAGVGSTVNTTAGTGANTVILGGNATNNVTFGAHTAATADSVQVAAQVAALPSTIVPTAIITGLNLTGADTIKFAGDAGATGPITAYTTTQINLGGSNPTTLAGAVNGILTGLGGADLAQHAIGEFQFQGNTFFVEQAGTNGSAFTTGDTVAELKGSYAFTPASTATGGVLHLVG
jgi:S-layer protein